MRLKLDELTNYQVLKEYNKETSAPSVYQIGLGVVFLEILWRVFTVSFWITTLIMGVIVIAMMIVQRDKFNKRRVLEKELISRMTTKKRETKKKGALQILEYIESYKTISYKKIVEWATENLGYSEEYVDDLLHILKQEAEIFEPKRGFYTRIK